MTFNIKYFWLFSLILLIEVIIAVFVNDSIIRPFIGDILVVVLLYFFVRMFVLCKKRHAVIAVLLFAYLIELGQYFGLVFILNLQDYPIARIVIGSTFDVLDLLAYTIGAVFLVWSDVLFKTSKDTRRV